MEKARRKSLLFRTKSSTSWLKAGVITASLALSACGFQPLYGKQTNVTGNAWVTNHMARIDVRPIPDRVGQKMRNMLLDRLNPKGQKRTISYRLETSIAVSDKELGLRADNTSRRNRQTVTASFSLIMGDEIHHFSLRSQNGFSTTDSAYSELVAKQYATDQNLRDLADQAKIKIAAIMRQSLKSGQ